MKTTIIKVETSDDVLSIRDRIRWCNSQRIILVIPRKRENFLDATGLALISRASKANGAQLGLVSRRDNILEAAEKMGVNHFYSLLQAETETWKIIQVNPERRERKGFEELIRDKKDLPLDSSLSRQKRPSKAFLISIMAAIVVVLSVVLIPSSKVVIYPITSFQELTLLIKASPEASLSIYSGSIPATKQTLTMTGEMSAVSSGNVEEGVTKAAGEIRVVNLTTQTITLPEGSVFSTNSPEAVQFTSTEEKNVPGDGTEVYIPIEAVLAGESGNVDIGTITLLEGILGTSLILTNDESTSGGSSILMPAPDESDYNKLYGELVNELKQKALEKSLSDATEEALPIPQSLSLVKVVEETRHDPPGEPSDTLSMSMTAQFSILYYDKSDLLQVIGESMNVAIPEGYSTVDETLSFEMIGFPEKISEDEFAMSFQASQLIQHELSWQKIKRIIIGKNVDQALDTINAEIPHYRSAEVKQSIRWWPYMPLLMERIQLEMRIGDDR
jgi:hypothetical protein